MKNPMSRSAAVLVVLAMTLLAAGCAKKAAETPPTPPPTPPQTEVPTPPPAQPPAETPPTPTTPGVTSTDFQPAFFDFDSYALRDDARSALDSDARLLRDNLDVKIVVEGHCDERGTAEYNQALGEKRAQVARDYLVAAGIDAARIRTLSYGKERPFDPGHDEAAWAKNRRAHFVTQ
jgi:peptidoglycan-associated lipoprotein